MHQKNSAFTLVELLVTIAIIGILVVLSTLGIRVAIEKSLSAKCMGNLKQIGAALTAYTGENNGKVPARYVDANVSGEKGWATRLFKLGYIDNPDVFLCPSFFPRNSMEATKKVATTDAAQAYGMRSWTVPGTDWDGGTSKDKPLAAVEKPSQFFIVADSVWLAAGWYSQGYGITPGSAGQFVHLRHDRLANTLFLDGHVEPKAAEYFERLGDADQQKAYNGNRVLKIGTTTETDRLKLQEL